MKGPNKSKLLSRLLTEYGVYYLKANRFRRDDIESMCNIPKKNRKNYSDLIVNKNMIDLFKRYMSLKKEIKDKYNSTKNETYLSRLKTIQTYMGSKLNLKYDLIKYHEEVLDNCIEKKRPSQK